MRARCAKLSPFRPTGCRRLRRGGSLWEVTTVKQPPCGVVYWLDSAEGGTDPLSTHCTKNDTKVIRKKDHLLSFVFYSFPHKIVKYFKCQANPHQYYHWARVRGGRE